AEDVAVESARRATKVSGQPSAAPPPADASERPCSLLEADRYTEHEVIGHGGSSIVIRAFDNDILRYVAVKILDPEIANDGSQVDRFAEEARITGQLEHPCVVPVYELGRDRRGRRFLTMKLIEGATLGQTLDQLGDARLEPAHLAELLQVFLKVCDAVSFAHSRGVIHRDLKPNNIMVSDFGQVYVLDWGIARLRPPNAGHEGRRVRVSRLHAEPSELDPPGSLVGTACYMPPEQLHGEHHTLDEQTDVFALGATLYQLLTGQPPLTPEIVRAVWGHKSPPAITPPERTDTTGRVPPELSRIAMRAVAYDPADRYRSVADLKRDIESFQRGAWDLPRVAVSAGSVIMTEGEPGDTAYVVLEGRCTAYRLDGSTELELRVMGPGEVFGETAIFSHKPRTASVKATTDVLLLKVTGDVLSRALGLNSWMGAFVRALADRFREADQQLRNRERPSGIPPELAPVSTRAAYQKAAEHASSSADAMSDLESFRRASPGLPRASIPAGEVIIAEGDSGDAGFVILHGRCTAYRVDGTTEKTLRDLGPGDVFGEAAVFSDRPWTVSVKAATDVDLVVVKRDVLSSALGLNSWAGAFVKALADRYRETEERLLARERTG
ncbi:MAG TPA: cyclic nucleotide-binding domain-containing protein, partial [Polyangiaceae bacterium]|nr:cyclic nucleotide-binding domain-containing protein [Polyangiaceae bacterium]